MTMSLTWALGTNRFTASDSTLGPARPTLTLAPNARHGLVITFKPGAAPGEWFDRLVVTSTTPGVGGRGVVLVHGKAREGG